MTTIPGKTERGKDRHLDIESVPEGLRVRLYSASGSGAAIVVDREEFRAALGRPRRVLESRESTGKTLTVSFGERPRPQDVYLWIQGVGQNGWSIFVPRAALEEAPEVSLAGGGRQSGARLDHAESSKRSGCLGGLLF